MASVCSQNAAAWPRVRNTRQVATVGVVVLDRVTVLVELEHLLQLHEHAVGGAVVAEAHRTEHE